MNEKRSLGPTIIGGRELPFSKGVVANGFVFLTGTGEAVDSDGARVEGIAAQTALTFERAKEALEAAGSTFVKAVRINQYLAARDAWAQYIEAREAWFAENAPELADHSYASTLVIQDLVDPDMLIEIEVTALA
jgi:enamine deaminase RidA (YjgF/YER057c/UK114 family)